MIEMTAGDMNGEDLIVVEMIGVGMIVVEAVGVDMTEVEVVVVGMTEVEMIEVADFSRINLMMMLSNKYITKKK